MNSRAAVVRLTFLGEGREPFGGVLGEGSSGGTDLLHCPKGVAGIDGLLGHLYSDGGSAGNLVGQGLGGFDYLRPGRQLVGDAPGPGTFRRERLTGEDQLLGSSGADEIAEPSIAAPAGEGAYIDLCQTERGILGNDPQIACQRQLKPPPYALPVTAAMVGCRSPARRSNTRCPRRVQCAHMSRGCNALKRLMSAPAQNERSPTAASRTTRTSRSESRAIRICSSCSSISGVRALCLWGRSRRIVLTSRSDSNWTRPISACSNWLMSGRRWGRAG